MSSPKHPELATLAADLRRWAAELGFSSLAVADTDLSVEEARLHNWLAAGRHGDMEYMARHGTARSRPAELVAGTVRVISVRMNYWPTTAADAPTTLSDPDAAYVSRYALGRDYHKPMRKRLQRLGERLVAAAGGGSFRAFVDSAPVMEKPLAARAGLGWVGKHSNLLARDGSWFFLGELYTDLPLPTDAPIAAHCGRCDACITVCPTGAIVAPYVVDARRCISYLTIEHPGPIPEPLRPLLGNRIYGCDDCQLVCPWNRHTRPGGEDDFAPRHGLDAARLIDLFAWDEATFLANTEGSPIRRIGYERWLRNIAVCLGNAPTNAATTAALTSRRDHPSALVREHVAWALRRHGGKD